MYGNKVHGLQKKQSDCCVMKATSILGETGKVLISKYHCIHSKMGERQSDQTK